MGKRGLVFGVNKGFEQCFECGILHVEVAQDESFEMRQGDKRVGQGGGGGEIEDVVGKIKFAQTGFAFQGKGDAGKGVGAGVESGETETLDVRGLSDNLGKADGARRVETVCVYLQRAETGGWADAQIALDETGRFCRKARVF